MSTALINNEFTALEDARVSVLDRGLLFSDSVYEVIPVYAGRTFRLDDHLARLHNSLDSIRLPNPYTLEHWRRRVRELIDANDGGDVVVYIQVTRGAPARRDHRLPTDPVPTVIAFCQSRAAPDPAVLEHGVAAITHADTRWHHCRIKSTSLLANVMAMDAARAAGAAEAILVRDGAVQEATSANVFAVINGRLVTPALRDTILPGITRAVVLEIAADQDVDIAEVESLSVAELTAAEEIWLSSSSRDIHAVTTLDGAPVGDGKPGALWTQMRDWLQAMPHD